MANLSTSGAVGIVVEHVPEVTRALKYVGTRAARRVAQKALRAGLAPVVKAIRAETKLQVGKVTGRLYKSPGQKTGKQGRTGLYQAKAGLNVGKKKTRLDKASGEQVASGNFAPHAVAIALGTRVRTNKKGVNRGQAKPHNIIPAAYAKSGQQALREMIRKCDIEVQLETIKARRMFKK